MNKVYRHKPLARNEHLGRVDQEGKVYETRLGPDRYVGRVDLPSGKIYRSRMGPDQHIGHIDIETGKVYYDRLGPDEYLGRVKRDGSLYLHRRLGRDSYIGKVTDMVSNAHGGAGFLLLVYPIFEEVSEAEKQALLQEEEEDAPADGKELDAGGLEPSS